MWNRSDQTRPDAEFIFRFSFSMKKVPLSLFELRNPFGICFGRRFSVLCGEEGPEGLEEGGVACFYRECVSRDREENEGPWRLQSMYPSRMEGCHGEVVGFSYGTAYKITPAGPRVQQAQEERAAVAVAADVAAIDIYSSEGDVMSHHSILADFVASSIGETLPVRLLIGGGGSKTVLCGWLCLGSWGGRRKKGEEAGGGGGLWVWVWVWMRAGNGITSSSCTPYRHCSQFMPACPVPHEAE